MGDDKHNKVAIPPEAMYDDLVSYMVRKKIPVTLDSYLAMAYPEGLTWDDLGAEQKSEVPHFLWEDTDDDQED